MEELKLKKQKRKTTKEIKKEEKKIKEEAEKKKKVENIVNAKDKAKKTKVVRDSQEKEKKSKLKIAVLAVLEFIVSLIEQFIMWLISMIGWVGILIILIVLVLMIVIYGLLHIDFTISDGKLFKGDNVEDCISSSQTLSSVGYDFGDVNQVGGAYTDQQKNIYRCLSIYQELFDGKFGKKMWEDVFPDILSSVSTTDISAFLLGFVSTENGMEFNNGNKDITQYTAHFAHNSAGYGGFGLPTNARLDDKAPLIAAEVKKAYPKPSDYTGYDTDFVPYAIAIQTYEMSNSVTNYSYLKLSSDWVNNNNADIEAVFDKYGVVANRDVLKTKIKFMGACCFYHGGGMNLKRVSLWTALWTVTSTDDSQRSFSKIKPILNSYAESSFRPKILGKGGKNGCTAYFDQSCEPGFTIDGKEINETLWGYVRKNCTNQSYFDSTAKAWLDSKANYAGNGVILNGHYGLMALLMGDKMLSDLGVSAPLASGGSYNECDCVETGGGIVGSMDISSIKSGEVQGPWNDDVKAHLESQSSNIKSYYGKANSLTDKNKELTYLNMTVEDWRKGTKWGVPYFFQINGEVANGGGVLNNRTTSLSGDGSSNYIARAGCHIYMQSYMASALTGTLINPVEMCVAGQKTGSIASGGCNGGSEVYKVFNALGLKSVTRGSGSPAGDIEDSAAYFGVDKKLFSSHKSADLQTLFDAVLSKNGIIGIACGKPVAAGRNHYVVVYEKKGDKYRMTGYNQKGSYNNQQSDEYEWKHIFKWMYSHAGEDAGYRGQMFIAYNPNQVKTSVGSAGKNLLFLGDSFTEMLNTNVDLTGKGHTVKATVGWNPSDWLKDENFNTLPEADTIDGVVVLLGINGVMNSNQVTDMKTLLDKLIVKYPNKTINVQKVFPVGTNYSVGGVTPAQINSAVETYNTEIKNYCSTKSELLFIDTTSNLVGTDGTLLNQDTEGIHISGKDNYELWWQNIDTTLNLGSIKSSELSGTNCVDPTSGVPAEGTSLAGMPKDERWKFILGESNYAQYYESSWSSGMSSRGASSKWKTYRDNVLPNEIAIVPVKAWDLKNGQWVDYEFDILIHKSLEGTCKAIFEEIYALPENERTPIHNYVSNSKMGGISYRHNAGAFNWGTRGDGSIHCIGVAFDFNPDENPMPGSYGDIKNYKPGVDPYSISDDSKFNEILEKYGFERGRSYKDYMHYSVLEDVETNNQKAASKGW